MVFYCYSLLLVSLTLLIESVSDIDTCSYSIFLIYYTCVSVLSVSECMCFAVYFSCTINIRKKMEYLGKVFICFFHFQHQLCTHFMQKTWLMTEPSALKIIFNRIVFSLTGMFFRKD